MQLLKRETNYPKMRLNSNRLEPEFKKVLFLNETLGFLGSVYIYIKIENKKRMCKLPYKVIFL